MSVDSSSSLVGPTSARSSRSQLTKRRIRDLVLVGVLTSTLLTHVRQRSAAHNMQQLLIEGYRYFELDVTEQRSGQFYWSAGHHCDDDVTSGVDRQEIRPALDRLTSFSRRRKHQSDIFVVRLSVSCRAHVAHAVNCGARMLQIVAATLASRSVPASDAFESSVDEILSTGRNIIILVNDLSSILHSSNASLAAIFVNDDQTVRNETDVEAWNVVDRGGAVLDHHRSVDTVSVLVLRWHQTDRSTLVSRLLSATVVVVCHLLQFVPLSLLVVCVLLCWVVTRLNVIGKRSMFRFYGGLAATSALTTLFLALFTVSYPSLSNYHHVNISCASATAAVRHWAARQTRFRLNIVVVDHRKYCCGCACSATPTSGLVGVAAHVNAGRIRRQVSLTHAGSPLASESLGSLRSIFTCPSVLFAYVVTSRDEGRVVAWNQLSDGDVVHFDEAEFPMDATVVVYVATVWNRWLHVSR